MGTEFLENQKPRPRGSVFEKKSLGKHRGGLLDD